MIILPIVRYIRIEHFRSPRMVLELASVRVSMRSHFKTLTSLRQAGRQQPNYLKHHWDGLKAALGFGPDRIKILVSMATDSSHRLIMGENGVVIFSRLFFFISVSHMQETTTYIRA